MLAMKAVRDAEKYSDQTLPTTRYNVHTCHTYTHNIVGTMDYIPAVFGEAPKLQLHRKSIARELAFSVALESGLHRRRRLGTQRTAPALFRRGCAIAPERRD
jgi:hypothetical protein